MELSTALGHNDRVQELCVSQQQIQENLLTMNQLVSNLVQSDDYVKQKKYLKKIQGTLDAILQMQQPQVET